MESTYFYLSAISDEERARLLDPEQTPGTRVPLGLRWSQVADYVGNNVVRVEGHCTFGGALTRILYPFAGVQAWANGVLSQDALPQTSTDEREFLQTGMAPGAFEQALGPEDDDDDGEAYTQLMNEGRADDEDDVDDGDWIADRIRQRDEQPPSPADDL